MDTYKQELENLSDQQVRYLLVDLIEKMEQKGNDYRDKFNVTIDGGLANDYYVYSAALLTQVNYIKVRVFAAAVRRLQTHTHNEHHTTTPAVERQVY